MRYLLRTCFAAFFLLAAAVLPAQAQSVLPGFGGDRAGTSGFQFLEVPSDARSAAMGQSVVTNATDASALFWNPALAAKAPGGQIGAHHTLYYTDVSVDYLAGFYPVRSLGLTLGGYVQALNSGEMKETTEFQPFGTGQKFQWVDVAVGLSVAQSLTDLFSYGLTAKLVRSSVLDLTATTVMADLGFSYRIGDTGISTAVAIRNFGLDAPFRGDLDRLAPPSSASSGSTVEVDSYQDLTSPTTFLLGVSYDVLHNAAPSSDLTISGQLLNPNDNAENLNFGAEYTWNDLLVMRGGYRFSRGASNWPSLGFGIIAPGLSEAFEARLDYGFNRHNYLGTVHRIGVNVGL
jgi:long-subunit fatty acid transport protein